MLPRIDGHRCPAGRGGGKYRVELRLPGRRGACLGCGLCVEACPVGAIEVDEVAQVSAERCIGCGLCMACCVEGA